MSNITELTYASEDAKVWDLINHIHLLSDLVTHPIRQFVTCLLSGFFVVGILLIIPAMVQTAAAYVWAAQVRKSIHIRVSPTEPQQDKPRVAIRSSEGHVEVVNLNAKKVKNIRQLLSEQDRTLFLYRLLACTASLLVLIFSTLPQLIFAVSSRNENMIIDQLWGWCHAIVYADLCSRSLATYLIVIPFGLLFWNYLFGEIVPRHQLLTNNVFRVILWAAVPISIISTLLPIIFVARRFKPELRQGTNYCWPNAHGLVESMYFDFIFTRIIPIIIVIIIGTSFLRWLPRNDYGVFYEPGIFFFFTIPNLLVESLIHIFHQVGLLDKLTERNFGNFMLISYSLYHMSFSGTFVFATMRSVISEIREEMHRRQMIFLGEDLEQNQSELHGTKRQTDLINGLQKQFSVAFRWKPDFTEEETRSFIQDPLNAVLAAETREKHDGHIDDDDEEEMSTEGRNQVTDDVALHYTILQHSSHLKKSGSSPSTSLR